MNESSVFSLIGSIASKQVQISRLQCYEKSLTLLSPVICVLSLIMFFVQFYAIHIRHVIFDNNAS